MLGCESDVFENVKLVPASLLCNISFTSPVHSPNTPLHLINHALDSETYCVLDWPFVINTMPCSLVKHPATGLVRWHTVLESICEISGV